MAHGKRGGCQCIITTPPTWAATTNKQEMIEMKIFRVAGLNKKNKCYEAANVMAGNHEQAIKLMAMSHIRVVCCDKRGVKYV